MKNYPIIALCLFFQMSVAHAFKFSPMSASIDTADKKQSILFYLENDSSESIAVVTKVMTREMGEDGKEINKDVKNEISVYPTQLIIAPNEKKSIKVMWQGPQKIDQEQAYRLIAEQLPIDISKDAKNKGNIKVLLRYVGALYVSNDKLASDIHVKELIVTKKNVTFVVENKGNKHQILSNLFLKIKGSKKEILLKSEELQGMTGENVLAKSIRRFTFKKTGNFSSLSSTSNVVVNFDKE